MTLQVQISFLVFLKGDSADSQSMRYFKSIITHHIKDVYVTSIRIGENDEEVSVMCLHFLREEKHREKPID